MIVPDLIFNAPASEERIDAWVERLALGADDHVLDVGCGRGELLCRLAERSGCHGVGVDLRGHEIERARERGAALAGHLAWHAADVHAVELPGPFQLAICIGAAQAFGGPGEDLEATLLALAARLAPGGRLLVGHGSWRRDPPADYLAHTGMQAEHLTDHDANVARAAALGFDCLHAETSTPEEWDVFEGRFLAAARAALEAHPEDADTRAAHEHWSRWHEGYRRWGRDTLGFGWYLLRAA